MEKKQQSTPQDVPMRPSMWEDEAFLQYLNEYDPDDNGASTSNTDIERNTSIANEAQELQSPTLLTSDDGKNKEMNRYNTGHDPLQVKEQKQLGDMEGEVKEIQMELAAIRRDRLDLHSRNQKVALDLLDANKDANTDERNTSLPDETLYIYSHQLPEVSKLRAELIKAKNIADDERFQKEKYEAKLKDLELKLNTICGVEVSPESKETRKFPEEEATALKTQIRDLKEEIEEMKITVVEKNEQLQEYRGKYLQAQQQVEELKRQVDLIEFDNKQVTDQIHIEIQNMKMQFQEKLQELAPLPGLLKGAQFQLQEATQLQQLAEDSANQLSAELNKVKEKLVIAVNNLNQEKADKIKIQEENKSLKASVDEKQMEIDELSRNMDESRSKILKLEEKLSQLDLRFKEKAKECSLLLKDLDEMRLEGNRSLSRCKDRSDSTRRYLQTQISELERQLVQSRAQCRACQKERDEIRQRMQIQINNLQENFEMVAMRLRALQSQISSLKSSYTVILNDEDTNAEFNKISTF